MYPKGHGPQMKHAATVTGAILYFDGGAHFGQAVNADLLTALHSFGFFQRFRQPAVAMLTQ